MKLTPLNITLACVLLWFISELNTETEKMFSWLWLFVLVVAIVLIDVFFRLIFKDIKRIWFLQVAFILVVGILMILLKLQR